VDYYGIRMHLKYPTSFNQKKKKALRAHVSPKKERTEQNQSDSEGCLQVRFSLNRLSCLLMIGSPGCTTTTEFNKMVAIL
jgi:hypothetical protein